MHQKTAALSIQPSVMEKSGSLIFISSYLFSLSDFLCERILRRITNSLRLIITDAEGNSSQPVHDGKIFPFQE